MLIGKIRVGVIKTHYSFRNLVGIIKLFDNGKNNSTV
jgi:hypothetical protein